MRHPFYDCEEDNPLSPPCPHGAGIYKERRYRPHGAVSDGTQQERKSTI